MQQVQLQSSELSRITPLVINDPCRDFLPGQFSFVVFVFISLGLILTLNTNLKCACKQSIPDFMNMDVLNNLDRYLVNYSIVIHNDGANLNPDTVWIFLQWKARVGSNLKAKLHIFPSMDMFNKGTVENALLTYLPGGFMNNNLDLIQAQSQLRLNSWDIRPTLTVINRIDHQHLLFYIKHLFQNRLCPNWLTLDSTTLGPNIIDLRGCVFSKVNENCLNLTTYKLNTHVDIYNLPDWLEQFIDVLNETWISVII